MHNFCTVMYSSTVLSGVGRSQHLCTVLFLEFPESSTVRCTVVGHGYRASRLSDDGLLDFPIRILGLVTSRRRSVSSRRSIRSQEQPTGNSGLRSSTAHSTEFFGIEDTNYQPYSRYRGIATSIIKTFIITNARQKGRTSRMRPSWHRRK
jgi:hypothetical protein